MSQELQITWSCHICGDERPDRFIGVFSTDISADISLPLGTARQNIRHCLDRQECVLRAKSKRFFRDVNNREK